MSEPLAWRPATSSDLDAIMAIQDEVHALKPESRDAFAAKLETFPHGSHVLAGPNGTRGYGVFHPWRLGEIPPLDSLPFAVPPHADCIFVHDVALLPAARRKGAARALLAIAQGVARTEGFAQLALVSVYDSAAAWGRLGFVTQPLEFDTAKRAQYGDTARYMVARLP